MSERDILLIAFGFASGAFVVDIWNNYQMKKFHDLHLKTVADFMDFLQSYYKKESMIKMDEKGKHLSEKLLLKEEDHTKK